MMLRVSVSSRSSDRRGAAFFVLILAVVLVVIGSMMTLVRSEWMSAMRQRERWRIETLERAIESVSMATVESRDGSESWPGQEITLPIDSANEERIEVTIEASPNDDGGRIYTAHWLRGNQSIDMLERTVGGVPNRDELNTDETTTDDTNTDQTNDELKENDDKP